MRRTVNFLVNLGDYREPRDVSLGVLVDLSGSMLGEPLAGVKVALARTMLLLAARNGGRARDEAMLMTFDSDIRQVCPWIQREEFDFFTDCLAAVPDACLPGGGTTRFYDAVWEALESTRTVARGETDHLLAIFSDGGEYGSTEHTRSDVLQKIRHCLHGGMPVSARQKEPIASLPAKDLEAIFEESQDGWLVFRKEFFEAQSSARTGLAADVVAWLDEQARLSRRPVRIFALHYGGGNQAATRELSEATSGQFLVAADPEAIPGVFADVVRAIRGTEDANLRSRLLGRLAGSQPENADWFKVVSVNDSASGWTAPSDPSADHPNYLLEYTGGGAGGSRRESRQAFLAGPGESLSADLARSLTAQQQSSHFANAGIEANPIVVVAFRGRDPLGTAVAGELVDRLLEANTAASLFQQVSNLFFVVLVDDWSALDVEARRRLYAALLELSNRPGALRPSGILMLTPQSDSTPGQGYSALPGDQYLNLATEVLVSLNADQALASNVPIELASSGSGTRFGAVGAAAAFLDAELVAQSGAGREIRRLLGGLFTAPADEDVEREALPVASFAAGLRASPLLDRLIESRRLGNLITGLDCPDIHRLAWYEPRKPVRFVSHDPGAGAFREVVFTYRDHLDYLCKVFLDIEEYVSVGHSLEFFKAELERNAERLVAALEQQLREQTEMQLWGHPVRASGWHAREFLARTLEWLTRYREAGFESDLEARRREILGEKMTLALGGKLEVDFSPERCQEYRDRLLHLIRNAPLPAALMAKYGSLTGLMLVGVGASALASLPAAVMGGALVLAVGTPLAGFLKLRRVRKSIADHLALYHAAHRARARAEALALVAEKLRLVYDHLQRRIGADDEAPLPGAVSPYAPEDHSERSLLAMLERHVAVHLPRLVPEEPPGQDEGNWFRLDVGRDVVALPGQQVEGPLVRRRPQPEPLSQVLRRYLGLARPCSLWDFPSLIVRFVPDLTGVAPETMAKLRIEELVRETRYRVTLLAPLDVAERQRLKDALGSAEWHSVIDRLSAFVGQKKPSQAVPLFSLWREVVRYELWLSRLARLVETQDPQDKNFRLFDLWRRVYQARREFREGLVDEALRNARARVGRTHVLFDVLEQGYAGGQVLHDHLARFSLPPLRMHHKTASVPEPSKAIFASDPNCSLFGPRRILGGRPLAGGWPCQVSPGLDDHECRFTQLVPVVAGYSNQLEQTASAFLDAEPADQEKHLLPEFVAGPWAAARASKPTQRQPLYFPFREAGAAGAKP